MAEASVALLITKLTSALGAAALRYATSLIATEVSLLGQFHSKLEKIVMEFQIVQSFLRQLGLKKDQTATEKAWAEQVRNAALEMEDIIDEYTYLLASRSKRRIRDFLRKAIGRAPKAGSLPDIAQRMEHVDSTLQLLSNIRERYDIKINVSGDAISNRDTERRWKHVADESSYLPNDDEEFVGMGEPQSTMLGWLTSNQGSNQGSRPKLISVWGLGGLGKTTLVTKIFKSQAVKENFHTHAWVTVSETFTTEDLLRKILKAFFGKKETAPIVNNMSHSNLVQALHEHLQGKSYLLVLDDVWSTDVLREVSKAVSVGACESRIVLTTRKRDVALEADHVLDLQPLEEKDAWALFCKKVFDNEGDTVCPPHLEHYGKAMLNKCQGLPLAIVALGRMLFFREKEELEWKKVYDSLNWQLINNVQLEQLKNILLVSFENLPVYLKPCFLYCSMFPGGCPMARKRLVRLWVAEGLVQSRGRLTMEEVAEDNLNELIHRGMLQVAERNVFGRVKSCRMHDLMREVALQISERDQFCSMHDNPEDALQPKARRLAINNTPQAVVDSAGWINHLRSLLLFDTNLSSSKASLLSIISSCKLLRVLDLQDVPIDSIPATVYHLFNLHYLSLRNTGVKEISESLGDLRNLETLDLKNTNVKKLPHAVTKLRKLRHLIVGCDILQLTYAYELFTGVKPPKGLWNLLELQNLKLVEASNKLVRHVGSLVKLRTFGVMRVRAIHCAELCISLSKMNHLSNLGIAATEGEMLELDTMSSPPQYLQNLSLGGRLKNDALPSWFCSLRNLRTLSLHWLRLREDPLCFLHESLPSLRYLGLSKVYEGADISFRSGWFPKLKHLAFLNMPFERIEIEQGALAETETLFLGFCQNLKNAPSGIEHLAALRGLDLMEMTSSELLERLLKDGDTRERIRSIQRVRHMYQTDDHWIIDDIKVS